MSWQLNDNLICRRILLIAALLVGAVLFWLLHAGRTVTLQREEISADGAVGYASDSRRDAPDAARKKTSRSRWPAAGKDAAQERRTVLLKVDSAEEFNRILEWSQAAGIPVKGKIEGLRWIKVAVTLRQAEMLARQIEDAVEFCEDVEMRIPQYLDDIYPPWQGDPGPAFGTSYLAALGVDAADEDRGRGVLVAVLDTALMGHDEFLEADILQVDTGLHAGDERTNDHGTAVTSLLCGRNGVSRASVLAYPVLDANGCGSAFDAAAAIVAAADAGAKVISMSFGAYSPSPILQEAVEYAAEKGALLVAAAGNNGVAELCYPAAYEKVIAVGAVDAGMNAAGFSNYGENLDVAAPGVGLLAATANEAYGAFTGTSAAVPCVAGVLANWLAANPGSSAGDAAAALLENCNFNGQNASGNGVVDQWRMLNGNTPGIRDVAVNAIHGDRENEEITVMVQNCTAEENAVTLSLTLNGKKWQGETMTLPPNECVAAIVKIPGKIADAAGTVTVNATVDMVDPNLMDARPENQSRTAVLKAGE